MTAYRAAVVVLVAAWAWVAWQAVTVDAWPLAVLCVVCGVVTAAAGWPDPPTETSADVERRLAHPVDVSELDRHGSTSTDPGRDSTARPGSPISPTTTTQET